MVSAASPPQSPTAASTGDCELLQLLDEFSADDFAAVVRAIDAADASDPELLQPSATDDGNGRASLAVINGPALPVNKDQQNGSTAHKKKKKQTMSATGPSQTRPVRRNDPNKARNGRKEELIYLHKKVVELETQLSNMKKTKASPTAVISTHRTVVSAAAPTATKQSSFSGLSLVIPGRRRVAVKNASLSLGNTTTSAAAARVWEELAERQRNLRVQSERENIRLKLVLETQLKIARSLEMVLLKPSSTRDLEKCIQGTSSYFPSQPHASPTISSSIPDWSDAAIFDELLAGVERSYTEIDPIFEANGLACMEATHKDARMRRDASGQVVMEIFANKVLPFGIHETGDAVWHHFVFGKEKVPNRVHTENAPKVFLPSISSYLKVKTVVVTNIIKEKNFGLKVHAKHKSANFRVKQVLRQHVEDEERIVIVWQALIDPVAFSGDPLLQNDVGFVEKGYIIMKRPPSLAGNLTLLQTCHIITPNMRRPGNGDGFLSSYVAGDEDGFARVGALTDFVLSATAANISTSYQIIENVLLEQSLKKDKSGHGPSL